MPLYNYKVTNESGKIFKGEINIKSEDDLVVLLREKGYTPLEIKVRNAFTDISTISFFKPKVKVRDLAIFCRQFAIVLEAGVPIGASLDVLRAQTTNSTMKECLNEIYESIQKGLSLSKSMKQFEDIFPEILINMVEAGEVSGMLDKVFVRMAEHFEKEFELNNKVKSAMTYPIIVLCVAIGVIVLMMTVVLPKFTGILKGFNTKLPILTSIIMGLSNFCVKFWYLILLVIIGAVTGIILFRRSDRGKRFFANVRLKLPILKGMTNCLITARFTRTLATLVSSGVLLIQSLEVTQKVLGNMLISEKLNDVINEIKMGRGLTGPLTSIGYFPPMVTSMIKIGEESGDLDYTLEKCADFYDKEVDKQLQKIVTTLEPIIILTLAGVVAVIMLSILLPMFTLYQKMAQ
ncbi:MAG: type II secretion system F family protein [Bacillota bacterium]|nr:type II secretion system F family protein [Bacillota bacterium]